MPMACLAARATSQRRWAKLVQGQALSCPLAPLRAACVSTENAAACPLRRCSAALCSPDPPTNDDTKPESTFDQWASSVIRILNEENDFVRTLTSHPTRLGSARAALITRVLQKILPPIYEIGTGQVIDALGKESARSTSSLPAKISPSFASPMDRHNIWSRESSAQSKSKRL
jgi:hypothetical protein